jgi:hypothetical protein
MLEVVLGAFVIIGAFVFWCDVTDSGIVCSVETRAGLLRAMFDVGYFPPNTPSDE